MVQSNKTTGDNYSDPIGLTSPEVQIKREPVATEILLGSTGTENELIKANTITLENSVKLERKTHRNSIAMKPIESTTSDPIRQSPSIEETNALPILTPLAKKWNRKFNDSDDDILPIIGLIKTPAGESTNSKSLQSSPAKRLGKLMPKIYQASFIGSTELKLNNDAIIPSSPISSNLLTFKSKSPSKPVELFITPTLALERVIDDNNTVINLSCHDDDDKSIENNLKNVLHETSASENLITTVTEPKKNHYQILNTESKLLDTEKISIQTENPHESDLHKNVPLSSLAAIPFKGEVAKSKKAEFLGNKSEVNIHSKFISDSLNSPSPLKGPLINFSDTISVPIAEVNTTILNAYVQKKGDTDFSPLKSSPPQKERLKSTMTSQKASDSIRIMKTVSNGIDRQPADSLISTKKFNMNTLSIVQNIGNSRIENTLISDQNTKNDIHEEKDAFSTNDTTLDSVVTEKEPFSSNLLISNSATKTSEPGREKFTPVSPVLNDNTNTLKNISNSVQVRSKYTPTKSKHLQEHKKSNKKLKSPVKDSDIRSSLNIGRYMNKQLIIAQQNFSEDQTSYQPTELNNDANSVLVGIKESEINSGTTLKIARQSLIEARLDNVQIISESPSKKAKEIADSEVNPFRKLSTSNRATKYKAESDRLSLPAQVSVVSTEEKTENPTKEALTEQKRKDNMSVTNILEAKVSNKRLEKEQTIEPVSKTPNLRKDETVLEDEISKKSPTHQKGDPVIEPKSMLYLEPGLLEADTEMEPQNNSVDDNDYKGPMKPSFSSNIMKKELTIPRESEKAITKIGQGKETPKKVVNLGTQIDNAGDEPLIEAHSSFNILPKRTSTPSLIRVGPSPAMYRSEHTGLPESADSTKSQDESDDSDDPLAYLFKNRSVLPKVNDNNERDDVALKYHDTETKKTVSINSGEILFNNSSRVLLPIPIVDDVLNKTITSTEEETMVPSNDSGASLLRPDGKNSIVVCSNETSKKNFEQSSKILASPSKLTIQTAPLEENQNNFASVRDIYSSNDSTNAVTPIPKDSLNNSKLLEEKLGQSVLDARRRFLTRASKFLLDHGKVLSTQSTSGINRYKRKISLELAGAIDRHIKRRVLDAGTILSEPSKKNENEDSDNSYLSARTKSYENFLDWVISNLQTADICETSPFLAKVSGLNPGFTTEHVTSQVSHYYNQLKKNLHEELASTCRSLSLALMIIPVEARIDESNKNQTFFLLTFGTWFNEKFETRERIINFEVLSLNINNSALSSLKIANSVYDTLQDLGIREKLLCITYSSGNNIGLYQILSFVAPELSKLYANNSTPTFLSVHDHKNKNAKYKIYSVRSLSDIINELGQKFINKLYSPFSPVSAIPPPSWLAFTNLLQTSFRSPNKEPVIFMRGYNIPNDLTGILRGVLYCYTLNEKKRHEWSTACERVGLLREAGSRLFHKRNLFLESTENFQNAYEILILGRDFKDVIIELTREDRMFRKCQITEAEWSNLPFIVDILDALSGYSALVHQSNRSSIQLYLSTLSNLKQLSSDIGNKNGLFATTPSVVSKAFQNSFGDYVDLHKPKLGFEVCPVIYFGSLLDPNQKLSLIETAAGHNFNEEIISTFVNEFNCVEQTLDSGIKLSTNDTTKSTNKHDLLVALKNYLAVPVPALADTSSRTPGPIMTFWWNNHSNDHPVISLIARDILSISASVEGCFERLVGDEIEFLQLCRPCVDACQPEWLMMLVMLRGEMMV
ncbi:hypothetical protein NADFUDRAFT_77039 [Nadsonia fulvescens var. elongata DSM 6958]|uniref:Uncharacterized protein n=1 Tax=Nadsonia fulvescens var. elongata DSM 6958 TaxID=857566 RepID=A0A1E3PNJ6_9ASCO|nr:hypothetical protein NADFUDRAFT_77039 [Nadsonia fulvescens var. elongata DSM 6958]